MEGWIDECMDGRDGSDNPTHFVGERYNIMIFKYMKICISVKWIKLWQVKFLAAQHLNKTLSCSVSGKLWYVQHNMCWRYHSLPLIQPVQTIVFMAQCSARLWTGAINWDNWWQHLSRNWNYTQQPWYVAFRYILSLMKHSSRTVAQWYH